MPAILEFASKHKVPLMVGGAALVGYMFLKGRGGTAVAAVPPLDGGPMPTVSPSAAQPEIDATQQQAQDIQNQIQQEALRQSTVHFNLALSDERQQQLYQGRVNQLNLEQQQHTNEQMYYYQKQQGQLAHEQVRLEKKKEGPGGFLGAIGDILGIAKKGADVYTAYQGIPTASAKPVPYYGAPYAPGFTPPIAGR